MPLLLNVRLRAASYLLMLVPLMLLAPLRGHGFAVFASPLGAGLLAVLLVAGGSALDGRGGVAALRAGAAVRASALAVFLAGFAFAYAQSRHVRLALVPAWAWALMLVSVAHMVHGAARDVGAAIDPRRGQRVWLGGFDTTSVRLRTRVGEIAVPGRRAGAPRGLPRQGLLRIQRCSVSSGGSMPPRVPGWFTYPPRPTRPRTTSGADHHRAEAFVKRSNADTEAN